MLLFHENRMGLDSSLPPVLCRAPLWPAPPSSAWFAPHRLVPALTMNDIGDLCKTPKSPQSDTDSSHSSLDSRDLPLFSSPLRSASPEIHGRSPITIIQTPDSTVPTQCLWRDCGKTFTQLDSLSAHVAAEHANVQGGLFYCEWEGCPRGHRGFNARYKMLVHVRTHTKERPHSCTVCGKSFSRAENLKIHARSHSGEKPYVCTVPGCGKAYSNSSDRFKHTRTHMVDKPYCCKVPGCQKRYTDPSSLRKHVKTYKHTNMTQEVNNITTENIKNMREENNEKSFYMNFNTMAAIPKTTSYSEGEIVYENTRQILTDYPYSEDECFLPENVYKINLEASRIDAKMTYQRIPSVDSKLGFTNETYFNLKNNSVGEEDDERNKLCFCKDLPCIHTNRYVQPEFLTVQPLSYDKIEKKPNFITGDSDLRKSYKEEPLNLKRKYCLKYENDMMNLEKKTKTDFYKNDAEVPLDLSNKTFF